MLTLGCVANEQIKIKLQDGYSAGRSSGWRNLLKRVRRLKGLKNFMLRFDLNDYSMMELFTF